MKKKLKFTLIVFSSCFIFLCHFYLTSVLPYNFNRSNVATSLTVDLVSNLYPDAKDPTKEYTEANLDIEPLLEKLGHTWHWAFIRKRIEDNWDDRVSGAKTALEENIIPQYRTKRKVLVYPGLILDTGFAREAFRGAPIGELVQWSDLISGLYILGHDVDLMYDSAEIIRNFRVSMIMNETRLNSSDGCSGPDYDYLYTDLNGHLKVGQVIQGHYKKKFRILDTFGTEQAYNNEKYGHRIGLPDKAIDWGLRGLNLKQFYTLFGHTRDNSFLGFIIRDQRKMYGNVTKQNISLIYGKDDYIKKSEVEKILPVLSKYTEVHMTLPEKHFKKYQQLNVVNHGLLKSEEYLKLIQKVKFVIGTGIPREGPGIIESIAAGCIYINRRVPDKDHKFSNKPTNRTLSSQHIYAEQSIGAPHVYTVDFNNATEMELKVRKALHTPVKPYIPFELMAVGYLTKLNMLLENQDLCSDSSTWPSIKMLQVFTGKQGASCNEVCEAQDLVCENTFFNNINQKTNIPIECHHTEYVEEIYAPAYIATEAMCVLQKDLGLFSCASYLGPDSKISRICPCRERLKFGTHVCQWG